MEDPAGRPAMVPQYHLLSDSDYLYFISPICLLDLMAEPLTAPPDSMHAAASSLTA
jgi:hypothetical protein